MVDQSTQALRKGLALAMACDHPDEIADWDINAIRDTLAESGLAIVPVEPTEAMLFELQAKLEASRDCSGRYHKRIAKLEAENARLQERLAIFQRNAGLATTEATP